jgi:DNA-binding Xre family transcriptional regulator
MGKRITRDRRLTAEEKETYRIVRQQIAEELPDIMRRGRQAKQRLHLKQVIKALREQRQQQGMSLADLKERTGIDRGTLSKMENESDPNVTMNTLLRYAEAVGKTIAVQLEDA